MPEDYVPGDNSMTVQIKTLNALTGSGTNAYVPGDNEDTVRIKILKAILAGGGGGGGGIPDAPSNGSKYARKDGAWATVAEGIADAPSDGKTYGRKDGAWVDTLLAPAALTPSSNYELAAPETAPAGTKAKFYITPSAGITLTLNAAIKIPSDSSFTSKSLTSGKTTIVQLESNGTSWLLTTVVGEY